MNLDHGPLSKGGGGSCGVDGSVDESDALVQNQTSDITARHAAQPWSTCFYFNFIQEKTLPALLKSSHTLSHTLIELDY